MYKRQGYLSPAPKTIYNEKVFKYSNFCRQETGRSIFEDWRKEDLEEDVYKRQYLAGALLEKNGRTEVQ